MQKNIENLAKGEFFSVKNIVLSNTDNLGCELFSNRKYEDDFTIYNQKEIVMNGYVYSTNNRVEITKPNIQDKNYKISFLINTYNLEEGDNIQGEIQIITDAGELTVPYNYIIKDDDDTKIINKIRTVDDYYNLVVENFEKAFNLYCSNKIYKSKMMNDEKVQSYYEILSKGSSKYIAFYEFFSAFGHNIKEYLYNIDDNALRQYLENNKNDVVYTNIKNIEDNSVDNSDILNIIEKIVDKDFIDSLAISYVRKGYHDFIAFNIFTKALSYGSTVNNLYKAILESLPRNYDKKLPLYVYRYFYEDRSYTFEQKISLYENVIMSFDETDDIYKLFYDEIKQFALSEIYQNKISEPLIKLYKSILKIDIICKENASN
ncbi:MAG: DUF5717 family protein, partial [Bacillota bacterium]|nr:DUF5717 family protein [Bacillota bacterium]